MASLKSANFRRWTGVLNQKLLKPGHMTKSDMLDTIKNMKFSHYKKGNDVESFYKSDVASKTELIDAYFSEHFFNSSDFLLFFRANKPTDLLSNAVLLLGHLTKNWNIIHFDPKEDAGHWTELNVPSNFSLGLIKLYKFNGHKPTTQSKFPEPIQIFGTSGTTSQSKLVPITRSRLLYNLDR